jgi:arsenate reductase
MDITLYHNPRCSKSREALKLLEDKGLAFNVHLYLEKPMSEETLSKALDTLGETMIRTGEPDYKEHIKGQDLSCDALVKVMLAYPKTIERPLVFVGDKMALGRPLENIEEIL